MAGYAGILLSAILVNNVVFARFLGICPYLGVSKKTDTALGMSAAVAFVMVLASTITWLIQQFVLNPFGLAYLQTIVFILVIASLVQIVELVLKKVSKPLYQALGIYLPLITTNCAILGVAILNIQNDYDLLQTVIFSLGSAIGFGLALVLFASIRERLELAAVPKHLKGVPIALITAGILSLGFLGFAGLVK